MSEQQPTPKQENKLISEKPNRFGMFIIDLIERVKATYGASFATRLLPNDQQNQYEP